MASDDFIQSSDSSRKARRRKNKYVVREKTAADYAEEIKQLVESLEISDVFKEFLLVSDQISGIKSIQCLGLGMPASTELYARNARDQTAFLILLAKIYSIPHSSVKIYDPLFTNEDHEVLKILGFSDFTEKLLTEPNHTLYYLPHAPYRVINEVVKLACSDHPIIGNCFYDYSNGPKWTEFQQNAPELYKSVENDEWDVYQIPEKIISSSRWNKSMNGLAVHCFKTSKSSKSQCNERPKDNGHAELANDATTPVNNNTP